MTFLHGSRKRRTRYTDPLSQQSEKDEQTHSMQSIPVGILGATGTVGQRFLALLENHPWFHPAWRAASDRSRGTPYGEAVRWKLPTPLPERFAHLPLSAATPGPDTPRVLFAALDTDIALELEPRFADHGCAVVSNSSAFRMEPRTPLVIPEVNAEHLSAIKRQGWQNGGYLVTNPNCSAIGLVLALKPLAEHFGIESLFVTTMQAVSGAGYPGVASLDILGNVVPFVRNEEEKMVAETAKLLGGIGDDGFEPYPLRMTAHCNRVAVAAYPREPRGDSCRLAPVVAAARDGPADSTRAAGRVP